jgi:hypothetical protein
MLFVWSVHISHGLIYVADLNTGLWILELGTATACETTCNNPIGGPVGSALYPLRTRKFFLGNDSYPLYAERII